MATHNSTGMLTVVAAADTQPFLRLAADGSLAGATVIDVGVTDQFVSAGKPVAVCATSASGTQKVITNDTTAVGVRVHCAANGRVSAAATTLIRGVALSAGVAGDVIEIMPVVSAVPA